MARMPHIQLDESINASCAILPGDPARVDVIASFMSDVKEEMFNREYKSITGTYRGRRILAISTGMGGASTAICVEELADLGVKEMIRIGSCGALQPELSLGELVICSRAVCDDGTSQSYLRYLRYADREAEDIFANKVPGDPAANLRGDEDEICQAWADLSLVKQCLAKAGDLGAKASIGSTRSHDALYLPQKPLLDQLYSKKGISASDMETAALFAVGEARGVRTCSILNVVVEWQTDLKDGIGSYRDGAALTREGEKNEILVALETLAAIK